MNNNDLLKTTVNSSSSLANSDLLTIIGIIIALAAYIATVRGRILDKASKATDRKRDNLKLYAKLLMLADIPLILSGFMLATYMALRTFAQFEYNQLLITGMVLFAIALIVLASFHAYEWYKSFNA